MDRNREARRASIVGSNGFNRRRHRTNSLRDSPDEDVELQESVRLRDRVKKDRDRERERDRERDLRERSSRSKRRRGGDETSEDSINDEEDEEDEVNAGGVRLLSQAVGSVPNHRHHHHSSSFSQPQPNNTVSSNHHLQHRKTFPPISSTAAKVSKAPLEMMSAPVPRKARSASTKRSHDWVSISNNSGGEPIHGSSPARQAATPVPAAPMSPSSSKASMRKKLKQTVNNSGPKLKPPNVAVAVAVAAAAAASKPSSSNPEELEIEIAEVLYGLMTQSQAPSSSKKEESREIKRNSSPVSNSPSANNPNLGSNSGPLSAVAPKRKRPRQIPENSSHGARSSPVPAKLDADQTPKSEILSPEKISGSAAENVHEMATNSVDLQRQAAVVPAGSVSEMKPVVEELRESNSVAKEEIKSPKEKESPALRAAVNQNGDSPAAAPPSSSAATTKTNFTENRKEEKFEIDLMAPPPQAKSSPDKEARIDLRGLPVDQKPVVPATDNSKASRDQANENDRIRTGTDQEIKVLEERESKERNVDLHLNLEKSERDDGDGVTAANKSQSLTPKKLQQLTEKSGHSASSLPLPMSMGNWPGGLAPMRYMAPLQGVVSMEGGGAVAPGHIQPLFSQPRPKRCATHCHIARNIHYLQQFMKMNPFWPGPAGSASLFGSKPCNLNFIPGMELHANVAVRGAQDKAQNAPISVGKEKGSQPASTSDSAQGKQQILIQQALPPVAPSNLLGPTFIFPLSQQQSAAPRPSGTNSPAAGVSSNTCSSGVTNSTSAGAVSFNYPNMPSNETQYLAILQNNGYPFPIPAAAVGGAPNYRATPGQALPLFNGSFYSSQMIHPSQLQHAQPSSIQSQLLQAHQNASQSSGGSSTSQKHLQGQHPRMQTGGSVSSCSGTPSLQNMPSQKSQPSQQQLQQSHSQYAHQSRARHLEGEPSREDSPSMADSRGSRASMNIYGQNFAMPMHPQNFGLMTHPATLAGVGGGAASATSASSNHAEKKGQHGSKPGPESLPASHRFAMSFGTVNGTSGAPGIDMASMAQNHALFHSSSEATRQNMQMMAAQKKNFRISDDGKSAGVDSHATEEERKILTGKAMGVGGGQQSIAFTRSDLTDGHVSSSIQANNVIESSTRSIHAAASGAPRSSRSNAVNVQNAHSIQAQLQQQQNLQLKQRQQQQQQQQHQQQLKQHMAANSGSLQQQLKQHMAANSGSLPQHMTANAVGRQQHFNSSSTMGLKFPSGLSGFPTNLVKSNSSSPSHSPQWKGSGRNPTPQTSSATTATLKNLPQQHSQTQISFGGNQKPSTGSQGQAHPSNNQTASSPMMVGSPTASSVSKGASGSPRTASSASTNNKTSQAPSLSAQPTKNAPSGPNQKSPSILGNLHVASASSGSIQKSSSGSIQKSQMQQQSQQQMPKTMQQQLFFSNPYAQSQSPHSSSKSSTTPGVSGYYMPRRQTDQHQQSLSAPVTSAGGLSLLGGANTNDPATAIAAATANAKGGGLPSQGIIHAPQFTAQAAGNLLPAGFSYAHPVPAAVQVKPTEQKQPAGNDNLNPWQPEKK
ncbi:protein TIME FOR COFFEE-like isoform X2 [Salvia splendens]|uniref:protein TIME FOR COFFEE-like isoform X2 n=1 Tax=Salvia splendens TaxID=180675 RepID=UPI001C274B6D|nr:protein TIME FOR COFFEE-like isoform X2 [Salvia splendens]